MTTMDLNLLRTFDALMEHRSVTRAAAHLGVTQPAVSHALARLRKVLDDPLFLRTQTGLQPTARAEQIAGGVRRGLFQLHDALAPAAFDPAVAERHFTIAAGSYFCTMLIPMLIERIRQESRGIAVRIVQTGEALFPMLDRGMLDLALGGVIDAPSRIVVEPIYKEKMVWVAAPDSPAARSGLSPDLLDDEARIMVVPSAAFEGRLRMMDDPQDDPPAAEQAEWQSAVSGRSLVTVYDSRTALAVASRTDLVARVAETAAAPAVAKGDVVLLPQSGPPTVFGVAMLWHKRQRTDPGLIWLRERIREAVARQGTAEGL